MVNYTRTHSVNGIFTELNSPRKQLPLFRFLLAPLAIFLTLVPSVFLALAKNPNKNGSIASMISVNYNAKTSAGIVLTPSLSFSGDDVFFTCIWTITMLGVSGLVQRNKIFGRFISLFLVSFTALQTFLALHDVFFNNRDVARSLNGAWQRAYESNKNLLKEIQYELSCKGFASVTDRPIDISESFATSCGFMMIQRFGPQLFYVVMMIFVSRLVQLMGVLALTFTFQKLSPNDDSLEDAMDDDSDFLYYTEAVSTIFSTIAGYLTMHEVQVGGDDDDDEQTVDNELSRQIIFLCDFEDEIAT